MSCGLVEEGGSRGFLLKGRVTSGHNSKVKGAFSLAEGIGSGGLPHTRRVPKGDELEHVGELLTKFRRSKGGLNELINLVKEFLCHRSRMNE